MPHNTDDLRELREAIFGNGSPGLKSQMAVMENQIDGLKETSGDNNKRLTRIERFMYAAGGGFFVLQILFKFAFK